MRLRDVRDWPVSTRVAAAALAAALTINLVVLLRPRHAATASPLVIAPVMHIIARTIDDAELIREAASRAPFGGTPLVATTLASNAILQQSAIAPPPVRPRLLGTVLEGRDGGFVVVELPDARVQLVRIGERAGELRLRSVAAGVAVFDDPHDGRITLRASPPGSGSGPRP